MHYFFSQIKLSLAYNLCGKILLVTDKGQNCMLITMQQLNDVKTKSSMYAMSDKSMEIDSKVLKFVVRSVRMKSLRQVRYIVLLSIFFFDVVDQYASL